MREEADPIKETLRKAKAIDEDMREYRSFHVEESYLKIQKKIEQAHKRQLFLKYLYKVAAILLLPLLTSTAIFSYLFFNQSERVENVVYHSVSCAPGLITQLELPDHSKVWLNSGSTLRYPSRFEDDKRVVFLSGEGYFDVVSDQKNPFYVVANKDIKVKAYGTAFNVNSYEDDMVFETVLENGNVDVFIGSRQITLKEQEIVSLDKGNCGITVSKIYTDEKTAWKDGRLIFRNASLEEVVKKLSRRYNVDIILHRESRVNYKFRASFSHETIVQALNCMKLAAPIEWTFSEPEQLKDSSYERQRIDLWLK